MIGCAPRRRASRNALQGCLVLVCSALTQTAGASSLQYVEVGTGFKTGTFGGSVRNDAYSVYAGYGYITDQYDAGAVLPVVRLDRNGGAVPATSDAGLGDLVLRGGRRLSRTDANLELYGSVVLKAPTADEQSGLGTGGTDIGAFLSARAPHAARVPLILYGGYIVVGQHGGDNLRNIGVAGIDAIHEARRSLFYGGLETRSAAVEGAPAAVEVQFGALKMLSTHYLVKVTGFAGLTDGGPDYGLTLGFARWLFTDSVKAMGGEANKASAFRTLAQGSE